MRFEVSERIQTGHRREQILASLEAQFRKIALGVTQEGEGLVVNSIEATFGSINRNDTTVVSVRPAEDGFLVVADVHYRPSVAFWILLPITCCFFIVPIVLYLYQRKTVRAAIAECFERVRNEHASGRAVALLRSSDSPAMAAPLPLPARLAASQPPSNRPLEPESLAMSLSPSPPVSETPAPGAPASEWYFAKDGQRTGPLLEADLAAMIARQELSRDTMVWQTGWSDWLPVHQSPLARHVAGPPPLTGAAVSNVWVWVLAFAPVIGAFCEGLLSAILSIPLGYLWWITILINVGLSILDEKKLRQAGHDTSKMGAAWLVPVYLFRRAAILRQNKAYFVVWCVLFALVLLGIL